MRLKYEGKTPGSMPTPINTVSVRMRSLIPEAVRTMVDDGTSFMLDQVKINTPISEPPAIEGWIHLPGGDGIHLREEIHRTNVVVEGFVYKAKVGSDKDYAPFVEEGTGLYGPKHAKYLIVPHDPTGFLAFPWHGQMHYATHVWHPGSPGQHMFLIGGSVTEESTEGWSAAGNMILVEGMRV